MSEGVASALPKGMVESSYNLFVFNEEKGWFEAPGG